MRVSGLILSLSSLLLFSSQVLGGKKKKTPSPTWPTPSPTTPQPTTLLPTQPSDEEICECYDINLLSQDEDEEELCYTYTINRVCDDNYYQKTIEYIAFDADKELGLEEECCDIDDDTKYRRLSGYNNGECEIVTGSECESVSQTYSNQVDGIKCEFYDDSYKGGCSNGDNDGNSDDNSKNGSGGDRRRLRETYRNRSRRRLRKNKSTTKESTDYNKGYTTTTTKSPSTTKFTICYDKKYVDGTNQANGQIEIGIGDCTDNQVFKCDVTDIIPVFCDETDKPTADPSTSPTTSKPTTAEPSAYPTFDPTTSEPTKPVTTHKSYALCPHLSGEGRKKLDAIILVDTDGDYTNQQGNGYQCNRQQSFVSEALQIIKGEETVAGRGTVPDSRVGVIEFHRDFITEVKSLYDSEVNGLDNDVTSAEMFAYIQLIEGRCDDDDFPSPRVCDDSDPTQLYEALEYVRDNVFESDNDPLDANTERDRFIIIFNNCQVPNDEVERICNEFEDYIRTGNRSPSRGDNQSGDGINVVIINGGNEDFSGNNDYILCLTEYDEDRVRSQEGRNPDILKGFLDETVVKTICNETPTPSPTTDPTSDPTEDPSDDPITNPTDDPIHLPSPFLCPELNAPDRKEFDAVLLVDTDGNYLAANGNTNQCNRQQGFVAEAISIIKSREIVPNGQVPKSRVGIVEFNRNGYNEFKSLFDSEINGLSNDVEYDEMLEFLLDVEGRCDDGGFFPSPNEDCDDSNSTQLYAALEYVRDNYFESGSDPAPNADQRDRYILIFNNCRLPNDEVERICNDFEDYIRTGSETPSRGDNQAGDGINVVIINGGNEGFGDVDADVPDNYLMCLAEYDDSRVETNPNRNRYDYATILEETWIEMVCNEEPSPSPTSDPTMDPAEIHTPSPTPAPTSWPTKSPTPYPTTQDTADCGILFDLDIVFVIDVSCEITQEECENQQEMAAEVFSTIRGPDLGPSINNLQQQTMKVRVAYIEMGSTSVNVLVDFNANPVNDPNAINTGKKSFRNGSVLLSNTDTLQDLNQRYVDYILDRKSSICTTTALNARAGSPRLDEALYKIMIGGNSLFDNADSANINRDREILIFSNCGVTDSDMCDRFEDEIRNPVGTQNGRNNGINVNMINTPPNDQSVTDALSPSDADDYLSCLTEYDPDKRIFNNQPNGDEKFDPAVSDFIRNSICDEPTPAPTMDPTQDPTQDPTEDKDYGSRAGNDAISGVDTGDLREILSQNDKKSVLTELYNKLMTSDGFLVDIVETCALLLNLLICMILCGYLCCCKKNKNKVKNGYINNKLQESDVTDVEMDWDDEEQLVK